LKDNVLAYEYQEHPRNLKVKLLNLHVSRCYNCKGFTVWVRDRLVFPIRGDELPEIVDLDKYLILNRYRLGLCDSVQLARHRVVAYTDHPYQPQGSLALQQRGSNEAPALYRISRSSSVLVAVQRRLRCWSI
jgi:hypothetical protein